MFFACNNKTKKICYWHKQYTKKNISTTQLQYTWSVVNVWTWLTLDSGTKLLSLSGPVFFNTRFFLNCFEGLLPVFLVHEVLCS